MEIIPYPTRKLLYNIDHTIAEIFYSESKTTGASNHKACAMRKKNVFCREKIKGKVVIVHGYYKEKRMNNKSCKASTIKSKSGIT